MMFQLSFPRLFGQESGTIWQYPSTGNEHQVGKDYPPEEQAWNRLATYVNAAQALATRKAGNTMLPVFFCV